ncbi:hypothetical protein PHMEG_0004526 [Phytophthora megakarya]|uniref:Uncharacterized protein n=1 Tax=Phytophthora megakarya TaxID=4795 RepID=A0A225WTQ1_9STRA|nr:hypothetical protein PHMEG_0004526 [Phytophthora megakarya]
MYCKIFQVPCNSCGIQHLHERRRQSRPAQEHKGQEIKSCTAKSFKFLATVVAYTIFTNGVDRVDQLRSTNPTRRKEKRLSISLLTWAIDLALINAFVEAVANWSADDSPSDL